MTHTIFLWIHIAAGSFALISGGIAALAEKGGSLHLRSGRYFALAMGITAVSAVALSILNFNPFMLSIGFFTAYLTGGGYLWALRIPLQRRHAIGKRVGILGLITAAGMLYLAFSGSGINVVLLVFGSILTGLAGADAFRQKIPKNPVALHGGRMGGAYIAATTAFLVVNVQWGAVGWLLPTVIGSPLIAFALRKYARRRNRRTAGGAE